MPAGARQRSEDGAARRAPSMAAPLPPPACDADERAATRLCPQPTSGSSSSTSYTHYRRRFEGRYALVTASTAGIGLAIARRLVSEGAAGVAVCSRRAENVRQAVADLRALARRVNPDEPAEIADRRVVGGVCHVADAAQRRAFLAESVEGAFGGRLDALVMNAAANPVAAPLLETPPEALDKLWEVNVKSALLMTGECMPYLERGVEERRRGTAAAAAAGQPQQPRNDADASPTSCVLFVSSVTAFRPPFPIAAYAVTKTALLGVVRALADELGPRGVRCVGLAPGIVRTKFAAALVAEPQAERRQRDATALGRLGTPEDMGGAAAFLLSDDAAYVTGETLVASGGMPSRL
jgi:dehydrogenase/reductase SDR family member 4